MKKHCSLRIHGFTIRVNGNMVMMETRFIAMAKVEYIIHMAIGASQILDVASFIEELLVQIWSMAR